MANHHNFNSLLPQLQALGKSDNYSNILNTLNNNYDSIANDLIRKWISNEILSTDEKKYLDIYSNVQLSIVKYCLFNWNTTVDVQTIIEELPSGLFQRTSITILANAVEYLREEQSNNANPNEDNVILVYMMRMIDARSLAYRLCYNNISISPKKLNDELNECLLHRQAKKYLYDVKTNSDTNGNVIIDYRHQFLIGSCTFAVALCGLNKDLFKDNEQDNKYIYLLAKYVRVVLQKENFASNQSLLYCIRGILALLTNCLPSEHWLNIINEALENENDENAQRKNPFNLDLFSLIINRLLASTILQNKTEQSGSNDETLLIDVVLVFLVKWSDSQQDFHDDDDEEIENINNNSSSLSKSNQLLRCFRSHQDFQHTAEIIRPYIHAKYDRLRLMALALLSNIMSNQDFEAIKNDHPQMAKELVELLFKFLNQAAKQSNRQYKGIGFDTLLSYLYRFLVQDFVKIETLPYITQIVTYAKDQNLFALTILRRISIKPDLQKSLLKNVELKQFLDTDANIIYGANEKMSKIIQDIRQNLTSFPKSQPTKALTTDNSNSCQIFISYCHRDNEICKIIQQKLKETELFTNIWVDKRCMRDNLYDTVAKAIGQSKIVLVLLSDHYCQSDFCQREWRYALYKEIKTYIIVVQEDYKKENYDWATFLTVGELYFKIHKDDGLQKLLEHLSEYLQKKLESKSTSNNHETELSSTPVPIKPKVPVSDRGYSNKSSIALWTPKDVQDWCNDNHLEKWCKPLNHYDGKNLLEFHGSLSKDLHIEGIIKGTNLTVFDIARFKSEIDKLSQILPKTNQPPKKKQIGKRRISKTSNK